MEKRPSGRFFGFVAAAAGQSVSSANRLFALAKNSQIRSETGFSSYDGQFIKISRKIVGSITDRAMIIGNRGADESFRKQGFLSVATERRGRDWPDEQRDISK
ncbi:MAG: hypothetical protein NTW01_12385 [Gammaproteobacteria bacterium]|nr:hypothetical protein [Gammaproteobacteria bacterium]